MSQHYNNSGYYVNIHFLTSFHLCSSKCEPLGALMSGIWALYLKTIDMQWMHQKHVEIELWGTKVR